MITRPMLAASVDDVKQIRFPCIISEKLDGIRCRIIGGEVLSRSNKPIQNAHVRASLGQALDKLPWLEGCDGELLLRDRKATFQDVSSAIMSRDGQPDFVFHVFDGVQGSDLALGYQRRIERLQAMFRVARDRKKLPVFIEYVPTHYVMKLEDLLQAEGLVLGMGGEGIMIRSPDGPYKCGRSTVREGYLLKLKRFSTAESVVVGLEEQEANENVAKTDELGRQKRSTHKAGKRGKGTLGAFVVVPFEKARVNGNGDWEYDEVDVFRIGGGRGLTAALRQEIWNDRASYLGKIVHFYYQAQGSKNAPRIPQFNGFRSQDDM